MTLLSLHTIFQSFFPARKDGKQRIMFYDGECGLCQRSVQFMLRADVERVLNFAPLQGMTAKGMLPPELRKEENLRTIVYCIRSNDGALTILNRSSAVLRMLSDLGGSGRIIALATIIPRAIRDWVYDIIAARRHSFFHGATCELPTPDKESRFLP